MTPEARVGSDAAAGAVCAVVEALPDGVLAFDRECRYTLWNAAMERISGVPAAAVLGRVAWEVFPFLREEGEDASFRAALRGEETTALDRAFRVAESGRAGFYGAHYLPLRDAAGAVTGGMATVRDTTASRRGDEAMRLGMRVLESMAEGVSVSDADGYILYTNPAEDRIFGYRPGELVGRHVTVQNALDPEENQRVVGEVIATLQRDGVWAGEWSNRRKDGTPFTTYARITALEMGGRPHWVCVQEDITARRAAERERERLVAERDLERQRLRTVFQQAPAAIAVTRGPEHRLESLNPRAEALLGPGTPGLPVRQALPQMVGSGYAGLMDRVYATGEPYEAREAPVRVGGAERLFDVVVQPLRGVDGAVDGVLVHGVEVSERVRARRLLEEHARALEAARVEAERATDRTRRLQVLTAALSGALTPAEVARGVMEQGTTALGAQAGVVVRLDESGEALELVDHLGYSPAQLAGWGRFPLGALVPIAEAVRTAAPVVVRAGDGGEERFPGLAAARAQHAMTVSVPLSVGGRTLGAMGLGFAEARPVDAAEHDFLLTLGRLCAQALHRARLYEAERDARHQAERDRARLAAVVEERDRALAEAVEANRSKSEFLATMSHELRTPLNAIAGYVDLLDLGIHGPLLEPQRDSLRRVRRNGEHLLALINDVLNFARIEAGRVELRSETVPLAAVLDDLETGVDPLVEGKGLRYERTRCPPGLAVRGDPEKIQQVLVNLLSNAVKFTEPGGWIRVSCEPRDGAVAVGVADSGRGIPAERLGAIFEPFVQVDRLRTLSGNSQPGVGLGLAISRELARAMGGELEVESREGEGSTFTLVLPAGEGG